MECGLDPVIDELSRWRVSSENVIDAKVIDFKRWLEYRHRRFVDDGLQLTPSSTLSVDDGRVALKCTVKPSCVIIDFQLETVIDEKVDVSVGDRHPRMTFFEPHRHRAFSR